MPGVAMTGGARHGEARQGKENKDDRLQQLRQLRQLHLDPDPEGSEAVIADQRMADLVRNARLARRKEHRMARPASLFRGRRCRLNAEGLKRSPHRRAMGTIDGEGAGRGAWRIKFDDLRALTSFHKSFVELLPEGSVTAPNPGDHT